MDAITRQQKDSMKSTWRTGDRKQWTWFHWYYVLLGLDSNPPQVPVHDKSSKVPYVPNWHLQRWVWFYGVIPLILHQLYVRFTGHNFGFIPAFLLYSTAFKAISILQIHHMRKLGQTYGFLDGDKHSRDDVPDVGVTKVFMSLWSTSTFRMMMVIMLAYRTGQTPVQANWAILPLEVSLYGIILDFWFYWYHRVMHEFDGLWQYHRTHHLTKHPNPLLTLYADHEQEFFDIAGIPLLAYITMKLMGLPMGFYEWWMCSQYVVFTELSGHSGLRICANPPSPVGWLLKAFDCELVIEDHDMHHRRGWKKSGNYGKQTRLWDRIFGTLVDRVECCKDNIDYENTAVIPLFG